jgi:hypothetical protein
MEALMQDVLFVVIVVAFFALAAGAVRLCDRVVGADEDLDAGVAPSVPRVADERQAA